MQTDLFPDLLTAAQRALAAEYPYESEPAEDLDYLFDDDKREEEPRDPVVDPQTGFIDE